MLPWENMLSDLFYRTGKQKKKKKRLRVPTLNHTTFLSKPALWGQGCLLPTLSQHALSCPTPSHTHTHTHVSYFLLRDTATASSVHWWTPRQASPSPRVGLTQQAGAPALDFLLPRVCTSGKQKPGARSWTQTQILQYRAAGPHHMLTPNAFLRNNFIPSTTRQEKKKERGKNILFL